MQLGSQTSIPSSPDDARLEFIKNPHFGSPYYIRFTCPELTSLCPVTGAPDFATIVIDYLPRELLVESKSLKLYLFSFRNHQAFHEDCTLTIGKRVAQAVQPYWFRIAAFWNPRGGIPIDVFWTYGDWQTMEFASPPPTLYLMPYRPRS